MSSGTPKEPKSPQILTWGLGEYPRKGVMTMTDQWSEGSQIFYASDKGFGVTPDLSTVCLGTAEGIEDAISKRQMSDNPIIDQIIAMEIGGRETNKQRRRMTVTKRVARHNKRKRLFMG